MNTLEAYLRILSCRFPVINYSTSHSISRFILSLKRWVQLQLWPISWYTIHCWSKSNRVKHLALAIWNCSTICTMNDGTVHMLSSSFLLCWTRSVGSLLNYCQQSQNVFYTMFQWLREKKRRSTWWAYFHRRNCNPRLNLIAEKTIGVTIFIALKDYKVEKCHSWCRATDSLEWKRQTMSWCCC